MTIKAVFPDGQGYEGTSLEQGRFEMGHMILLAELTWRVAETIEIARQSLAFLHRFG